MVLTASENGWEPAKARPDQCEWIVVPGTEVHLRLLKGWPMPIMRAYAADYHAFVEPLRDRDSAGWTPTNSVATSNHLNGTAMDLNWDGPDGKTFRFGISEERAYPGGKAQTVRELLEFYEGTIFCGGAWSIRDWMHFQMGGDTFDNPHTGDFIARKIRPDGFSTFRRGTDTQLRPPAPPAAAAILADAMGKSVSPERYAQLLPGVSEALNYSQCTNLERITMWVAQIGHESGGLRWMEEIASGAAYEGRRDLGNTQPGDGERYKGRGPIQVTGRHNYTELSKWASSKSLTPTPTFFVDNPNQLSSDQYGFLGAIWYWTVARPRINSMCDNNDLEGVTRAINGGLNGLDDRRRRWNYAKSMGDTLLQLLNVAPMPPSAPQPPEQDDWMASNQEKLDFLYNAFSQPLTSRSELRDLGQGTVGNLVDLIRNTDGAVWELLATDRTRVWHPNTLALLHRIAEADPVQYPDRQGSKELARAILADYGPGAPPSTAIPSAEPPPSTAPPPLTYSPPPQVSNPLPPPPAIEPAPVFVAPPESEPIQGEIVRQPSTNSDWKSPVVDSLNMLLKFEDDIPAEAVEAAEKLIVALTK